jgi:Ca2+-binding EF-hand superfamily protein
MFSGANRARIHAEKQKKKKRAKKQAKKEIPQKKAYGVRLPKFLATAFGIKEDENPDLAMLGPVENKLLKDIGFGYFEKVNFLDLFRELCGEGRSRVTYRAFCLYFKFKPDKWIRRLFDLINSQVTGSFTFLEFIQFCARFLYIDRDTTEEFCFRFLSRRGLSFMPEYSILDLDDFVTFVALRYRKYSKLPKQRKLALDIFASIDYDGDGGVTFDEFQKYCRENPVFLRLSHPLQNHLRKCVFGIEFWVDKSRAIKTSRGSTFEVISKVGGRINRESEMYTLKHIQDPVIDKNGYALRTRQKAPKDEDEDDSDASDDEAMDQPLEQQPTNPETEPANGESKDPENQEEDDPDDPESMQISREKLSSIVAKDQVEDPNKELLVLTNNNKEKYKEKRKKICFFGSFSIEE